MKGGGHAMAAGVTLKKGALAEFRAYLEQTLGDAVAAARRDDTLRIDAALSASAANAETMAMIARAGPFGAGNRRADRGLSPPHHRLCGPGRPKPYPRAPEGRRRRLRQRHCVPRGRAEARQCVDGKPRAAPCMPPAASRSIAGRARSACNCAFWTWRLPTVFRRNRVRTEPIRTGPESKCPRAANCYRRAPPRRPSWPRKAWAVSGARSRSSKLTETELLNFSRLGNVTLAACRRSARAASPGLSARAIGQSRFRRGARRRRRIWRAANSCATITFRAKTAAALCADVGGFHRAGANLWPPRRSRSAGHGGQGGARGTRAGSRAPARRRRHLPWLARQPAHQRPGRCRLLQAAEARCGDRPLGIHLWRGPGQGIDRRTRLSLRSR